MKTKMKIRLLGLLAMALLFPATLCGQKLHRYVVEVVTEPVERVVKVEKLINGDSRVVPQGRRRTVSYYEIISRTPLTLAQCNDSIRLGKARLVPNPRRSRKVEEDLLDHPQEHDDGRRGGHQSLGCGADGVRPDV